MGTAGPIRMSINAHLLIAWFSPSFPTGAFSYSHGLEAAIAKGQVNDQPSLANWLAYILRHGSAWNDCLLIKAAYAAENDAARLDLTDLARGLATGHERRLESELQGAAFAKTIAGVYDITIAPGPLPLVVGTAAQRFEMDLADVMRHFLHGFASNLISVAMRLMPIGQVAGQQVLTGLFPIIDDVVADAMEADLTALGGSSFFADLASIQHETIQPRLFRT